MKFGCKRMVLISMILASTMTVLTTQAAWLSSFGIFFARLLVGFANGIGVPSTIAIFLNWSPEHERTVLVSLAMSGGSIGTVLALPISGILCDVAENGWEYIFYVFGSSILCFYIQLFLFVYIYFQKKKVVLVLRGVYCFLF
jgi:MFS transporter, ACS family, solute carrier family 17 (sodium-dependent inorganic phosphate cotransporter), member 5